MRWRTSIGITGALLLVLGAFAGTGMINAPNDQAVVGQNNGAQTAFDETGQKPPGTEVTQWATGTKPSGTVFSSTAVMLRNNGAERPNYQATGTNPAALTGPVHDTGQNIALITSNQLEQQAGIAAQTGGEPAVAMTSTKVTITSRETTGAQPAPNIVENGIFLGAQVRSFDNSIAIAGVQAQYGPRNSSTNSAQNATGYADMNAGGKKQGTNVGINITI